MEKVHPHALRGPADIPVIEGLARAMDGRRVDPAGARLQHMDDAADHPPIIDARLASRVGRQVRRDPRELPIRQPEMIATACEQIGGYRAKILKSSVRDAKFAN